MLTPFHAMAVAAVVLLLGGCCRDTLREMASIKDVVPERSSYERAPQKRAAAKPAEPATKPAEPATKAAAAEAGAEGASQIETGSIKRPENCQGAHVAYQATREYLKNFGPRPPDQPGEKGACMPDAQ